MIKLAGPVIVAGPGRQQTEAVRQGTQPAPGISIMILMVDLDAIQPAITSEVLDHAWREQAFPTPTPRMSNHGEASGLMHQLDSTFHLDRVAGRVGWTTVGEETVERLLPIAYMPGHDQRVGDVRATNRGTVADLGHHLGFADRYTKRSQFGQHAGQPTQATIAYQGHLRRQPWTGRISAVREDVHTAAVARARELHSAYHTDAPPLPLGHCLIQSVECVVVSQRDHVELRHSSLT